MSRIRRRISWRVLVPILVTAGFLAAGVTAFWELLQPYAHILIVLTLIVFGMAIASHFLMLLLLDPKSKQGISLQTSPWTGTEYWMSWEGFQQLCLVLLAVLIATVIVMMAITTLRQSRA